MIKRNLPENQDVACHLRVMFALSLLLSVALIGDATVRVRVANAEGPTVDRGINIGNALDGPQEGSWGVTLEQHYFDIIKAAGFSLIRLPIRWSAHAATQPPYTIDPEFFARVDWAINSALSRNMSIIIDMHHYTELNQDPDDHFPRLLALWDQIALHYHNFPQNVVFELLNEPAGQLTDERWQAMIPKLLSTVRTTNQQRTIIVGPGFWNSIDHLNNLHLPDDDKNLLVTFHYYAPIRFTHQGAPWVNGADQWKDVTWAGTKEERQTLSSDFEKAAIWGHEHKRALYLGEFGSFETAEMESRARWTEAVAREAEKHGFSWSYWEFCSSFGAYDPKTNAWREPLLRALVPQ